jgi:hypothetical protein
MRAAEPIPHAPPNSFQLVYAIFLGFGSGWHVVAKAYLLDGDAWDVRLAKTTMCHASLPQRCQHILRAGVIAERLAYVDEEVFVSWSEHKATAELHGIFA